jgi:hypothetical protein
MPTTFNIVGLADRAAEAHLPMFVGDDVTIRYTPAKNMSGMQLRFACERMATTTPTVVGTFPAQTVVIPIADTATSALKAGSLEWALWRTDDGSQTVLAYGTIVLTMATASRL